MYDRTGLSTKCTLIKTGFKNARTGTKAKFRPFVDALADTVCFACHGSGPNSVNHGEILLEYGRKKQILNQNFKQFKFHKY